MMFKGSSPHAIYIVNTAKQGPCAIRVSMPRVFSHSRSGGFQTRMNEKKNNRYKHQDFIRNCSNCHHNCGSFPFSF